MTGENQQQLGKSISEKNGFGAIFSLLSSQNGLNHELLVDAQEEKVDPVFQELLAVLQQQTPVEIGEEAVESPAETGFAGSSEIGLSPDEWMELPLKDALFYFFNGDDQKFNDVFEEYALPKGKAGSTESLLFLQSHLEKLEKHIHLKVIDPSSVNVLQAIKQLSLAAKESDSPAAASPVAEELLKTLEKLESVLKTLMTEVKGTFSPVYKLGFSHAIALSTGSISSKSQLLPDNSSDVIKKQEALSVPLQQLQTDAGLSKWSLPFESKTAQSSQSLMQQFVEVMDNAKFGKTNGTEKLLIRLQPEHLGTLKIELIQKSGVLTAKVMTSTGVAKDMLESQVQQLRHALTNQNIQIDRIEIIHSQSDHRTDRETGQSSKQHADRDQKHRSESEDEEGEEKQDFQKIFLNIEV
ncbi:hypothetical protein KR50_18870 [Jeotgalibacillus campisalis]|uniref:Flagellar hook-length control protein-like C-terminal domain-containing protein n=2 Tax=Jeotgalibacillus campisalis TaxID=220754 RepID=A0A0C2RBN1_9BACL|nr:hypothetical protein KR50_18870 [Jeotgalibacillus campisalis]